MGFRGLRIGISHANIKTANHGCLSLNKLTTFNKCINVQFLIVKHFYGSAQIIDHCFYEIVVHTTNLKIAQVFDFAAKVSDVYFSEITMTD